MTVYLQKLRIKIADTFSQILILQHRLSNRHKNMSYQISKASSHQPFQFTESASQGLLIEDYYSTLRQLQQVTCCLEQNEEVLHQQMNHILSEEQLQLQVKDIVQEYLKNKQVIQVNQSGKQKIRELQYQRKILEKRQQQIGEDVQRYKQGMHQYLQQNSKYLKQLHNFCERQSILKVCQPLTTSYIESLTHSSPCSHSSSSGLSTICIDECPFSALKDFIKMYKPNRICEKVCQLWQNMEKQMFRMMSFFMRHYDNQECFKEHKQIQAQIQETKKQIMKIKVDVQIGVWEGRDSFCKIGFQIDKSQENFIQEVIRFIKESQENQFQNHPKHIKSQVILFKLRTSFQNYLKTLEISKFKCSEYFQPALKQLQKLIRYCLQNIKQKNNLTKRIQKFQQNLQRISQQISYLKLKELNQDSNSKLGIQKSIVNNENEQRNCVKSRNIKRKSSIVDQFYQDKLEQSKETNMKIESSCISTKINSAIEISCLHKSQTMTYRVIKKMHITQNRSSIATGRSSRGSLYSVTSSLISLPAQNQPNFHAQSPSERILQLSRHKLLLYRNNPHFRQQIELKRIKQIKIISSNILLIYFRKGYIEIQFLESICNSNQLHKKGDQIIANGKEYAKEWISIFEVVYAQYLDSIKILDQSRNKEDQYKENVLVQSNLIVDEQNYNQKCEFEQNGEKQSVIIKSEQNQFFSFNKISRNNYKIQKSAPIRDLNLYQELNSQYLQNCSNINGKKKFRKQPIKIQKDGKSKNKLRKNVQKDETLRT